MATPATKQPIKYERKVKAPVKTTTLRAPRQKEVVDAPRPMQKAAPKKAAPVEKAFKKVAPRPTYVRHPHAPAHIF